MMNEAIMTSDIIVKGFVITKNNDKLIERYKKIFPNYYIQQYPESFFFMDLDRIDFVKPFYYAGSASTEYIRLFIKPFIGDAKYQISRIIPMETFEEIKELLIERNRYDILLNLEV